MTHSITLSPSELEQYLATRFASSEPANILITGDRGLGKTSIVKQAAKKAGYDFLGKHGVTMNPTHMQGLGFKASDSHAEFLPYGFANAMLTATRPLIVDFEDLGQAAQSVQAAIMEVILEYTIDGKPISPFVKFLATTNERGQYAGVQGILSPVRGRFTILKLRADLDDSRLWFVKNGMPDEMVAYLGWRGVDALCEESKDDMTNAPNPRNWHEAGREWLATKGLNDNIRRAAIAGRVGIARADEFIAFANMWLSMPSIDAIFANPQGAPIDASRMDVLHATIVGLASRIKTDNQLIAVTTYCERMLDAQVSRELVALVPRIATIKTPEIVNTSAYVAMSAGRVGRECIQGKF